MNKSYFHPDHKRDGDGVYCETDCERCLKDGGSGQHSMNPCSPHSFEYLNSDFYKHERARFQKSNTLDVSKAVAMAATQYFIKYHRAQLDLIPWNYSTASKEDMKKIKFHENALAIYARTVIQLKR